MSQANSHRQTVEAAATSASGPSENPRNLNSVLHRILGALPTLCVLALLGATGYWGHYSGWKIPKFSELTSNDKIEVIEWCDEHGVPEAECVACNAGLMPKGQLYGWCKEHGVHECVLHHPQTAQLKEMPVLSQSDSRPSGSCHQVAVPH